jgi:hypothetical protein
MTTAVYLCPKCSSGAVTTPILIGSEYVCTTCGWHGTDPFTAPLAGPFASGAESIQHFCSELLNSFSSSAALPLGRILVSWGLVSVDRAGKPNTKELARYLHTMAKAMALAVIEEQTKMDRERVEEMYKHHADPIRGRGRGRG